MIAGHILNLKKGIVSLYLIIPQILVNFQYQISYLAVETTDIRNILLKVTKYNIHNFSKSRNAYFVMVLKLKIRGRKFKTQAQKLECNNPLNQKLGCQDKRKYHIVIHYIEQYEKYAEYLVG
ncbi:hypothetical protein ABPG72_015211 [Tetrahymena utriculariae]